MSVTPSDPIIGPARGSVELSGLPVKSLVFGSGHCFKVLGIQAFSVAASVMKMPTLWNRSMCLLKRAPVHVYLSSIDRLLPVPILANESLPNPAPGIAVNHIGTIRPFRSLGIVALDETHGHAYISSNARGADRRNVSSLPTSTFTESITRKVIRGNGSGAVSTDISETVPLHDAISRLCFRCDGCQCSASTLTKAAWVVLRPLRPLIGVDSVLANCVARRASHRAMKFKRRTAINTTWAILGSRHSLASLQARGFAVAQDVRASLGFSLPQLYRKSGGFDDLA